MRVRDEAKEQLILESALKVINQIGLAGLKMSDLAKESNLATGTVYIYFKDKNELIRKLYTYLLRKTSADYTKGVVPSEPLKIKIRKISYNYLKDSILNPQNGAFFEQYFRSPFFQETKKLRIEEESILKPIYDLVVKGQQEAIIKNTDPELLVILVCGMINEVSRTAIYMKIPFEKIDFETVFGVIWDGIRS